MLQFTTGLILATMAAAPTAPPVDDATVMQCDFEETNDVNFDGWPDGWQRRLDASHPVFVDIAIVGDSSRNAGNHFLRISPSGKTAAIFGPQIDVDATFSYVLEGQIMTKERNSCIALQDWKKTTR